MTKRQAALAAALALAAGVAGALGVGAAGAAGAPSSNLASSGICPRYAAVVARCWATLPTTSTAFCWAANWVSI